jgi:hypothetical protein
MDKIIAIDSILLLSLKMEIKRAKKKESGKIKYIFFIILSSFIFIRIVYARKK